MLKNITVDTAKAVSPVKSPSKSGKKLKKENSPSKQPKENSPSKKRSPVKMSASELQPFIPDRQSPVKTLLKEDAVTQSLPFFVPDAEQDISIKLEPCTTPIDEVTAQNLLEQRKETRVTPQEIS